jgi:hypothetical protein
LLNTFIDDNDAMTYIDYDRLTNPLNFVLLTNID